MRKPGCLFLKLTFLKKKYDDDGMKEDSVFYFTFHLIFPVYDFTGHQLSKNQIG